MANKENFRVLLRKSGYKATLPRLAILEIFKSAKRPLSAQDVIGSLPKNSDQATVYRTLKSLKEKGLIRPVDLRHNHAHYELANLEEHHHLICLMCGKIEDVHQCGVDDVQMTALQKSKTFDELK